MVVESSVLIALVATSLITSFFSLFRRIRIFRSCCCQSDCMNESEPNENNIELTNLSNLSNLHNRLDTNTNTTNNSPMRHRKLPHIPNH